MKELFKTNQVEEYAIIKTLDDYDFVGNDIDVIIKSSDFDRLYLNLIRNHTKGDNNNIDKINYDKTYDSGKMDLFIKDGLKIDVHTYVGWRNVKFFDFNDVEKFITVKKIFGCYCNCTSSNLNSIFIALTHVYEKGYLTLDEYLFLQTHYDEQLVRSTFPLSTLLHGYVNWLAHILASKPKTFPVFLPRSLIFKSYISLLKRPGGRVWKLKALLRDLPLITFWNIRYKIKGRLPFEVGYNPDFMTMTTNSKITSWSQ